MYELDEEYTPFITDRGLYCYKLVKSKKAEDHINDLDEMFKILWKYQMKWNPYKYVFGIGSRKFLGFMVNQRSIEADPQKIQVLIDIESPCKPKDVQNLAGKVATLSWFVSRSAEKY